MTVHERGLSWRAQEVSWSDVVAFSFYRNDLLVSVAAPVRYGLPAGADGHGLMCIDTEGLSWTQSALEQSFAHYYGLYKSGAASPPPASA